MNSDNVFDEIKNRVNIRQVVEYYHEPVNRNHKVHCPMHQDKTPSLSVDEKKNMFNCFSAGCEFAGDPISFVAGIKKVDNLEAAKIINHDFNLCLDFDRKELSKEQLSIREYIVKCQQHIGETDYLQKRGLTLETLKRFGVGYDPEKKCVVIPYSSAYTYYQTRNVLTKAFYKPENDIAGEEPIWNENALRRVSTRPIIVVESPICAMSIMQYGGNAIALCGVSKIEKMIDIYKKAKNTALIVLALDNDEAGQKGTAKAVQLLRKARINYLVYNVAGQYKDPNDLMMHSADQLCKELYQVNLQSKKKSMSETDVLTGKEISEMKLPPIRWVVKDLIPEGLSILVAPSKIGKSWMMLDLVHSITEKMDFLGKPTIFSDVLYYSLEDTERRLKSRGNKVWQGKPMSEHAMFRVTARTLDTGLLKDLEAILEKNPGIKVVIFDTFQFIRGQMLKNESTYAYDYREMTTLKHFADLFEISIILVHHQRKMVDENDFVNMASGSTAIVGGSDTAIFIYKKKRSDEDATLSLVARDVYIEDLVINRDFEKGGWFVVGSPEEKERMRKENEFNSNPIAKTLLALLEKQPSGWSGTVRQLLNECYDYLHVAPAESESAIGKLLSSEDFEYRIYKATRCEHTSKRRSNGVVHTFARKQRNLFDKDYQEKD